MNLDIDNLSWIMISLILYQFGFLYNLGGYLWELPLYWIKLRFLWISYLLLFVLSFHTKIQNCPNIFLFQSTLNIHMNVLFRTHCDGGLGTNMYFGTFFVSQLQFLGLKKWIYNCVNCSCCHRLLSQVAVTACAPAFYWRNNIINHLQGWHSNFASVCIQEVFIL